MHHLYRQDVSFRTQILHMNVHMFLKTSNFFARTKTRDLHCLVVNYSIVIPSQILKWKTDLIHIFIGYDNKCFFYGTGCCLRGKFKFRLMEAES